MVYNEVDDVLAAANFLISHPNVDATHLYLAGHSVGGTLVLLAAMTTDRFRAAASFSGSPDQIAWSNGQEALIPFDKGDMHEFQMRSPIAFATSFKCPVRIYYGSREQYFDSSSQRTASLARQKQLDVEAISVPGDHFGAVPEEIHQSIKFFRTK
jgi:dipeptidyl aminopeptidase/acylaminoacyl peptidase